MNRNNLGIFRENISFELNKIRNNEAYINNKSYFGLDKELLSYIRKLEQALDEIEKIILKATTDEETGKDLGYSDNIPYYDLLEIIQKAKGNVNNENNNI